MDEYDSDGDLVPDVAFSESDNGDVANYSDVIEPVDMDDSEADDDDNDPEVQQLIEQGFEICQCEHAEGEQSGGSRGQRCALRQPDTLADPPCSCDGAPLPIQPDARLRYLERSIGVSKIALMQELGVLDRVLDVLPDSALIMTAEEDPSVM